MDPKASLAVILASQKAIKGSAPKATDDDGEVSDDARKLEAATSLKTALRTGDPQAIVDAFGALLALCSKESYSEDDEDEPADSKEE